MGWEGRARGGTYYTRSKRINGRVHREYLGGGLIGLLSALIDEERRAERQTKARACQVEQARIEEAERTLERLTQMSMEVTRGVLQVAGYRQHHRGDWRRRREQVHSRDE